MHHIQYNNNSNLSQQQQQENNKSISWCKKRTLYQNGGGSGPVGLRPPYSSPQDFTSPSYFEGLGEEEGGGGNHLDDEEDLNTVLQSYLESTSFSDGQSSSSPSQQSTDSGFAGDGYSTPSSTISYYNPTIQNPPQQQQQATQQQQPPQQQQPNYSTDNYYYNTTTPTPNNNQAAAGNPYYSNTDYVMHGNNNPGNNNNNNNNSNNNNHHHGYMDANSYASPSSGGSSSYDHSSFVHNNPPHHHHPEDDFHSSEDLSVIVDQVLNSIDEAQFDTSNYGPEYSALMDEAPSSLLSCDHCGTPNLNKECKNCEMNSQQQQTSQLQQQQQQQQEPQLQHQQPSLHQETLKPTENSTFNSNSSNGCQKKSSKTVAAVQPIQRSVGVVEPRVVVKIPMNKIRSSLGDEEEGSEEEEEFEGIPTLNNNNNNSNSKNQNESVIDGLHSSFPQQGEQENVGCIDFQSLEEDSETPFPGHQEPMPPTMDEANLKNSDNLCYSKDLMNDAESVMGAATVGGLQEEEEAQEQDFSSLESFKLSSLSSKKSNSSHHHHHKKKKHKRKKKKLCKCGGSKKRKRCETPTTINSSSFINDDSIPKTFMDAMEESVMSSLISDKNDYGKSVNPLKIVRISNSYENEEFKIKDPSGNPEGHDEESKSSSTFECPVLERQVYDIPPPRRKDRDNNINSFGKNNASLLTFRDLALKAAAAEGGDNVVMYSNEEDEGEDDEDDRNNGRRVDEVTLEGQTPPPPSITPPPPTLHRHDSPEPCDKETNVEESLKENGDSKEELVDLLADLPTVLPLEPINSTHNEPPPVIKVEAPEQLKEEKGANESETSLTKSKILLEKDPEDEWLYCQTKNCHFWTRKPKRMERHKRTHAGTEEDMYYVCPDCFAKFYSLAKMLKHDRKFHTGEKDYECKICEAEVTDIHVHMRVHRADKEFRCSTCPLTFRHKNSLVRHVFQHSGERPYKCQTCNSGFFSLGKLKEHVRRRHPCQNETLPTTTAPIIPIAASPSIKTEGLVKQYPKLAPRINNNGNGTNGGGDDDVVIVGLKPAPPQQQVQQTRPLTLPATAAANSRTILAPSSIILPPQPAPQGVVSYLAQGPNGSVYLVTNPAPGANLFLGQGGEGILMPQQPLFIPQSPVLIPQQSQAPHGGPSIIQSNSNSTLFVVPTPVLNVPTAAQPTPKPQPEKKLDILQQAILEIPDHFQSFEEE